MDKDNDCTISPLRYWGVQYRINERAIESDSIQRRSVSFVEVIFKVILFVGDWNASNYVVLRLYQCIGGLSEHFIIT